MSQAAGCLLHLIDLQEIENRPQNAQAATDDRSPVVFHAGQTQSIRALRAEQFVQQPVQALSGDAACGPTSRSQDISHGAHGAGRPIGHVPGVAPIGIECFVQHRFGRNFCHFKGVPGELVIREITCGPCNAADTIGFHLLRLKPLTQDQFGRAAANVNHQTALISLGQRVGDPLIN